MATVKEISIDGFIQRLSDLEQKEVPLALARALQDSGQIAKAMIQAEINSKVDDPTPFTQKAAFGSSVQIGETSVTFGLKDFQGDYLFSMYQGGERKLRPFETKFKTKFGTKYLIPHGNTPRDAYGNVPLAVVKQIMQDATNKTNGYYVTKKQIRHRPKGGESKPVYNLIRKEIGIAYIPQLSIEEPTKAALDAFPGLFVRYIESGFKNSEKTGRYR
jgi:hypothetical protein